MDGMLKQKLKRGPTFIGTLASRSLVVDEQSGGLSPMFGLNTKRPRHVLAPRIGYAIYYIEAGWHANNVFRES